MIAVLALLAAQMLPPRENPCSTPVAAPRELTGWDRPTPRVAATASADVGKAALPIGAATTATLTSAARVSYAVPPARPAAAGSYGGLFAVTIARAGRYRIALGGAAWIDVVRDGKALASVGHGHGPACSSVRKMVDFDLTPGRYVVQLAGAATPSLTVMVAALAR